MKKFIYQGRADSAVTLKLADGKDHEVMLWRGKPVNLPEENAYVQMLVASGHLVAVQSTAATVNDTAPTNSKGAK
jgi:hypothetical protein